jgi:hypothetical protein
MALPVILFNATSGSDTAASGAGPATALTNTDASTDGTGLVVTVPNADLSGVAVDGSHVIWVKTVSGRQYGKITAKASSGTAGANVTVATAFATGLTGRTYGIGGKRKTLDHADSRTLFADAKPGWIARLEQAGGAQVLTATLSITANGDVTDGNIVLEGDSASARAVVTTATSSTPLITLGSTGIGRWTFRNCTFSNTAGTRANGFRTTLANAQGVLFDNCVLDGFNVGIESDYLVNFAFPQLLLRETEIKNCVSHAIINAWTTVMLGCHLHDNGGDGYNGASSIVAINPWHLTAIHCVFEGNNRGVSMCSGDSDRGMVFVNCDFNGNTGDGLRGDQATALNLVAVVNSIFWGNGGYGINFPNHPPMAQVNLCNAFGSNTSGARNNFPAGTGGVTLTGNPWVDAAAGDYDLDNVANEGAACRSAGWPGLFQTGGMGATQGYADIGASRHPDPVGGSGVSRGRVVNAGGG